MSDLLIDLFKLRHNINTMRQICLAHQLELIGVVKGCYTFSPIIQAFQKEGIGTLGMSRIQVGIEASVYLNNRPILITLPSQNEAQSVVRYFQASLNSEVATIKALADAAEQQSRHHGIILMVDTGDLREGVMPEEVLETVRKLVEIKSPNIHLQGLGANLGCASGTLPSEENLNILDQLAVEVERVIGLPIETISVGGSLMFEWIARHRLPSRINQIRAGEIILLGNIPTYNIKHPDLYDDVFLLRGEVLEIQEKPSIPQGDTGLDAFGERKIFKDRGIRKRAILNFGIVDTAPDGLYCKYKNVDIVTSNSDYTIADVTDCSLSLKTGDRIEFTMNYNAMIQSLLSPFVRIILVGDKEQST